MMMHPKQREAMRFEQEIVNAAFKEGRRGIVALPGVREIMAEVWSSHVLFGDGYVTIVGRLLLVASSLRNVGPSAHPPRGHMLPLRSKQREYPSLTFSLSRKMSRRESLSILTSLTIGFLLNSAFALRIF